MQLGLNSVDQPAELVSWISLAGCAEFIAAAWARLSSGCPYGTRSSLSRHPRLRQRVSRMSKPRQESKRRSRATVGRPTDGKPSRGQANRIDPPHEVSAPPDPIATEPVGGSVAVGSNQEAQTQSAGEAAREPIQVQADQLAGHLRDRQKELDYRESHVNAGLAALDRDMRAARLWLQEREAEIAERGESLDRREADLEARERELGKGTATGLQRSTAEAHLRQKEIDLAESRVQQARAEAESLREQLRQAHEELREEGREQRRRLAAEQRAALAEIEQQRETVRRRGEHVDQCHAALEQLRAELGRMHRETLEIRLATEELWVQLSVAAPPAALTKSLSGIRSQLADHYRLANAELQERKQELETIRRQLADQYERVVQQKQKYDLWAQQHREDAESDASRLAAREAELLQLQVELNDRALQWQAERLDYEQQIRRLKARRPGQEAVAAAMTA